LAGESEDCLVLNVWTPGLKDGKKRPVMFWCHGGGFYSGSGASSATDGTNLARSGDVVVVTINHRLNVLGFTYLEEFGGAAFAESGDVGMLDIVQALQWVRANIAEFGGDAGNVTIFGQSGGGRKVQTLLAMPVAKGLFHRGIIQSGASLRLVERDQAVRVAAELMKQLGLERTQVRELQKLPLERVMSAYHAANKAMNVDPMTMGFAPTVNGRSIPTHPFHPQASPVSADVPVMTGSTRTEWTGQADKAAFSLSEAGMRERIEQLVGSQAGDVIATYRRLNPKATASQLYFLVASDHRYTGPTMKVAERRAALGRGPVYLYYFRWETTVDGGRYGSPHGIEVSLAFANPEGSRMTAGVPGAVEMSERVSSAWVAFARSGNPNGGKLPAWREFEGQRRATMVFDRESRVEDDPIREQREVMFRAWGYS
jgi:para-nitrobenzyl esterase